MLIAAVPLIERLGRRTLLIWVAPVCIASLLAIGGVVRSGSSSTGGALVALASVQDSFSSRASEFPLSGLQLFHTVLPHSGLHPPLFLMPPLLLIPSRCLWQAAYSLGVGPMGYVYVAETSTMRLRAKTTGLAITGIQAMATVYVYIAPIMLNAPGLGMSNTGETAAGRGVSCHSRRRGGEGGGSC
jgi:SP family general alpha glucoside:H+ symporter-like MFS transporter